jgi:hypothetical protein
MIMRRFTWGAAKGMTFEAMIVSIGRLAVRAVWEGEISLAARPLCAHKGVMSILNEHKKKMGRPPVDSELVRARIQQPLLGQLDAYADSAGIPRSEAIRRLVEKGLESE